MNVRRLIALSAYLFIDIDTCTYTITGNNVNLTVGKVHDYVIIIVGIRTTPRRSFTAADRFRSEDVARVLSVNGLFPSALGVPRNE